MARNQTSHYLRIMLFSSACCTLLSAAALAQNSNVASPLNTLGGTPPPLPSDAQVHGVDVRTQNPRYTPPVYSAVAVPPNYYAPPAYNAAQAAAPAISNAPAPVAITSPAPPSQVLPAPPAATAAIATPAVAPATIAPDNAVAGAAVANAPAGAPPAGPAAARNPLAVPPYPRNRAPANGGINPPYGQPNNARYPQPVNPAYNVGQPAAVQPGATQQ